MTGVQTCALPISLHGRFAWKASLQPFNYWYCAQMASFRSILGGGSGASVRCTRPSACVLGESAYVVCGESIQGAELVATNLFVREDGAWKLVHHQAGPVHRRAERRSPPPGVLN